MFHNSLADPSLFSYSEQGRITVVILYVDDILVTGTHRNMIEEIVSKISNRFTTRVYSEVEIFLGIYLEETSDELKVLHEAMIKRRLK